MSFIKNLEWRYATKKFDASKKVSEEDKNKILEAIRMAPTSFGTQPFHINIVESKEIREELKKNAWGQAQFTDAPILLVFSSRNDLMKRTDEYLDMASQNNSDVRAKMKPYEDMIKGAMTAKGDAGKFWAAKQAYIALGFAMAACAELEIDSCPMEGFDANAFDKILGLPDNLHVEATLAIGYRVDDSDKKPKTRFSKEELFSIK